MRTQRHRVSDVGMPSAGWRLMRPHQWTKNLLVLGAPLAAGQLFDPGVAAAAATAVVAFCLVSSGVYCINDVLDAESDRLHPRKRLRPVAAGQISPLAAATLGGALMTGGVMVGLMVNPQLALLLVAYSALQVAYSVGLKREPVIDLAIVTAGFLMRAVAGGVAADIRLSQWFLLVAGFGSLFMVAGKRYSELHVLGSAAGTRRSLVRYTTSYLRFVWSTAAGATLLAYSLWAFEMEAGASFPWHTISIGPFVIAILRYAVDIDAGLAAEPDEIVWRDQVLLAVSVLWLVTVTLGVVNA